MNSRTKRRIVFLLILEPGIRRKRALRTKKQFRKQKQFEEKTEMLAVKKEQDCKFYAA